MNQDYKYCTNEHTCLHRRGCKRWVGNYSDDEVKELYTESRFVNEIDFTKCIPDYSNIDCDNDYNFLDRFRNSDGSKIGGQDENRQN